MTENRGSGSLLVAAGLSSFAIAIVHLVIMFIGPPAYRWFGAPALAVQTERGSIVPAVMCIAVAAILAVWGLYALAGAGRVRRLPLLRTGIIVIGTIYFLRGLLGIPQLLWFFGGHDAGPMRYLAFSLVSGVTGVLYLAGLFAVRRATRTATPALAS